MCGVLLVRDKEKIKQSFSKSAPNYDRYVDVQKEMMARLFPYLLRDYRKILDIGSGTGTLVEILSKKYPSAQVVGVDLAPGMVKVASSKVKMKNTSFLVGDGEELPFKPSEFDLVVSNAALQWMDIKKVFQEVARVLTPQGSFCFTTFGPATLRELKRMGLSVNDFPSDLELEKILRKHFKRIEISGEILTKYYRDVFELFFYLKEIGAQNPNEVGNKGLLTKKKIISLFLGYERGFEASYEIYYGFCEEKIP